jgi:hypothetical protein
MNNPKFDPATEFRAAARFRDSQFSVARVLEAIQAERRRSLPTNNVTMLIASTPSRDSYLNNPALSRRRRNP